MDNKIKLIYGIGNDIPNFENTKHNLGKEIIKTYLKKPEEAKNAFYEKNQKIILATNKGFINESGKGLKELIEKFKIKPKEILVIHDDADLIFPIFKINFGSGSGGHKGIKSIIENINTKNFWRFKIGIQNNQRKKHEKAEIIVLKKWNKKDKKIFENIKKKFKTIFELLQEKKPNELNIPKNYFLKKKQ